MPSQAFYRKWRSQRFADLVGQEPVARTLRNAVRTDRIAHAYLFCGPRGVGKTSAARILAKAVNCANVVEGEPCATCAMCQAIQEGRAIDILELDAASNRGIDQVRDIREKVGLAPAEARYKFYILDEAHMLTTEAFNALLKTIEEPPPHTVFVLVTTDAQRLPETIVSRCQRLDFRRISVPDAVARLSFVCQEEGISPEPGVLELLARTAAGSLRDAEGSLDQIVAYAGTEPTVVAARAVLGAAGPDAARELLLHLVGGRVAEAIRLVNRLVEEGADPRLVALDVVDTLRALLLLRTAESLVDLVDEAPETLPILRGLAQELDANQIVGLIRCFTPGPATRGAVRPQLPFELAVVEAAQLLTAPYEQPRPATAPTASVTPRPRIEPELQSVSPERPAPTRSPEFSPRATDSRVVASVPPETVAVSAATNGYEAVEASGILAEEAQRHWNDVLEACGAKSRSLQALLRSARPLSADDTEMLVLGFQYPFHRERIEDQKNRVIVEDVIAKVLNRKVRIRCTLANKETATTVDPLHSALEDPIVKAAISLGARVRSVTDDSSEEKQ